MENKKRKRSANFSQFENDILIDIITKYKQVIENKKTDGISIKEKDETWKKVEADFNSIAGVTLRNHENLKTYYENVKRKTRKMYAEEKVQLYKTGGGSFKPSSSGSMEKVMALIEPTINPLPNQHDSDAPYQDVTQVLDLPCDVVMDGNSVDTAVEEMSSPTPLAEPPSPQAVPLTSTAVPSIASIVVSPNLTVPPRSLSTPQTSKHRVPKMKTPRAAISNACETRISLFEQQIEIMKREHSKEMEIKELQLSSLKEDVKIKEMKFSVLKEKLKYWQNNNSANC
ncbi:myb/SANT-like DNA-binding domain-containing protein 3 [Periplaneta americana]|uniref:myb/SANT-like DNA-binding domain-containing protein 3 n=1 Tax=Periplaneta americana TaxID=6978 RepID=UPI0037E945DC